MMRKWTICGFVLALTVALAGCGKSGTPSTAASSSPVSGGAASAAPTTAVSPTKLDAEAIAKANCISCHGADLAGKVGPNLQKIGAKLSRDQIKNQITNGGGGMPSMKNKLKPEEIDALADWLAAKK